MVHRLKTWVVYFKDIDNETKNFEVRKNDRPFSIGDILILEEFNPDTKEYTGKVAVRSIKYILFGGQFGIEHGYVVLGLEKAPMNHDW